MKGRKQYLETYRIPYNYSFKASVSFSFPFNAFFYVRNISFFKRFCLYQDNSSFILFMGMATIFLIKVWEDTGVSNFATDTQLSLSSNQLFIDSTTKIIKLKWNFIIDTTNLLDWVGMFEMGKEKIVIIFFTIKKE